MIALQDAATFLQPQPVGASIASHQNMAQMNLLMPRSNADSMEILPNYFILCLYKKLPCPISYMTAFPGIVILESSVGCMLSDLRLHVNFLTWAKVSILSVLYVSFWFCHWKIYVLDVVCKWDLLPFLCVLEGMILHLCLNDSANYDSSVVVFVVSFLALHSWHTFTASCKVATTENPPLVHAYNGSNILLHLRVVLSQISNLFMSTWQVWVYWHVQQTTILILHTKPVVLIMHHSSEVKLNLCLFLGRIEPSWTSPWL